MPDPSRAPQRGRQTGQLRLVAAVCVVAADFAIGGLRATPPALAAADPAAHAVVDGPCNVEYVLNCGPGARPRLLLGSTEGGDGIEIAITSRGISLSERSAGQARVLTSAPMPERLTGTPSVLVCCRPAEVCVWVNGALLLRTGIDAPVAGPVGLSPESAGCTLDQLTVQPIEPVCFSSDFFDARAVEPWQVRRGQWRVETYRDPLVAQVDGPIAASWYRALGPDCLATCGQSFWEDYSLEASIRFGAPGGAGGLALGVQGDDDYWRVRVDPRDDGRAQVALVRVHGGEAVVASADAPYAGDGWHRIGARAVGGEVLCRLDGRDLFRATADIPPGDAGLWASGEGTEFDDVQASAVPAFAGAFVPQSQARWQTRSGSWHFGDGTATAKPASRCTALARTPAWTDARVEAMQEPLPQGVEAGILAGASDDGAGYQLGLSAAPTGRKWTLAWGGHTGREVLAEGVLDGPTNQPAALALELSAGRIRASVDGERVGTVYDVRDRGARVGLYAEGRSTASFTRFYAEALPDRDVTLSWVDGHPRRARTSVHGEQEVQVLGTQWVPFGGAMVTAAEGDEAVLRPEGTAGSPVGLAYWEPCAGDVSVLADVTGVAPASRAGVWIAAPGMGRPDGYEMVVSWAADGQIELLRAGQCVAQVASPGVDGAAELRLRRDGPWVTGWVSDRKCVQFLDPAPLPSGFCGVWVVSQGDTGLRRAEVASGSATSYAFRDTAPEWEPVTGVWPGHTGMACIDWDYWITGVGEPRALLIARGPAPADVMVRASVSEYTDGYETGAHTHYPYHDVGLTIGCRDRDPATGYRFVVGADGGREVRLYRDAELVARTDDARFAIRMGSHCNEPRTLDLVARCARGHVSLAVQGMPALEYVDPSPLPAGHVALTVDGCKANFRDVVVTDDML